MTNVSIIGCGWLGLPLAKSLVKKGYAVKGSTTNISKFGVLRAAGIKPFLINLDPEFKGEAHFLDSDILIVNLPPRNIANDPYFHEKQLQALHDKLKRSSITHVIFVSSTAVYHDACCEVKEHDACTSALSRSGISLLQMENIFFESEIVKSTVVRFAGLYGPDRHPGRFLAGKQDIPGGNIPVNIIHLDDCIGVIQQIIEQNIWGERFNACSPNHPTRKHFYQQAALDCGLEPPTFTDETKPYKIVSSSKLQSITGYTFVH